MITGFNTDVDFNGVTYHVQTEDKGIETPLILSLVYNRGTILASKRSPYNDLLLGGFNEKELVERLNRQHKLICAAIKAGRIEDLKQMNAKQSEVKKPSPEFEQLIEIKPPIEKKGVVETKQPIQNEKPTELKPLAELTPIPKILLEKPQIFDPIKKPNFELPQVSSIIEETIDEPIEITDADLIFDEIDTINDTQNLSEVIVVQEDAVEVVTDLFAEETVDENKILVQIMNEVVFRSGESKTISILVSRNKSENTLAGVNVMVKILGSNFRPLIFHTKTDSNGVAIIHLQIPPFSRGRAAVLFKAMNNGDESEIRRVIQSI